MGLSDLYIKAKKKTVDAWNNDASGLGIAKNTVLGLKDAGKKVFTQGPGQALSDSYNSIAKNTTLGTAIRFPEELAKTMYSGTKDFVQTSGNVFGEGLAYGLDKNVRDQYKAGNTEILPTVSRVSPLQMMGKTVRAMSEVWAPKGAMNLARAKAVVNPTRLNRFIDLGTRVIKGAAPGYAYDVSNRVSDGADIKEGGTWKPGVGTGVGALFGAGMKPTAQMTKEQAQRVVQGANEQRRIWSQFPEAARNSFNNRFGTPKTETIPAHYVPSQEKFPVGQVPQGYRVTGTQDAGFNNREALTEKLLPEQRVVRTATPTLSEILGKSGEALPRPGLSIQDVSRGKKKLPTIEEFTTNGGKPTSGIVPPTVSRMDKGERPMGQPGMQMVRPRNTTPIPAQEKVSTIHTGEQIQPLGQGSPFQESVSFPKNTTGAPRLQEMGRPQVTRIVNAGKQRIFVTGPEENVTGVSASIRRRGPKITQVEINNEPKGGNVDIQGTPLLAAGKVPTIEQFMALPSGKRQMSLPSGGRQAPRTILPESKNPIVLPEDASILNPEAAQQAVADGLAQKFDAFERGLYGDTATDVQGGMRGANAFQSMTRGVREKLAGAAESGLSSENGLIRNISRGLRGLMGGLGNTADRTIAQGKLRGGVASSQNIANDFQALGDVMLPDKLSREKVWALLDPELSGVKVDMFHLTAEEQKAVDVLRQASDLINDQNFALGRISHEVWMQGRGGKYITRAYTDYDLPPELSEAFQKGRGKLDLGAYKSRTEVNDWKQENAIKDPFYLAAKRIQSTFSNKAISDFGSWAATQKNAVSDALRPGYTQLSDSPMWGELSGKIVRHDILEAMKGFYSDNKALQGLFDALNAYDRWMPRQILKKTKTVYNPATRLGNQVSNRVFALFNGVNPAKFEYNMHAFAPGELKNNGKYARLLRERGVIGTDMTKYELVRNLANEGESVGVLGKADNVVSDSYGAVDDKAKLSAFKYWLDKGKTVNEAIIKVQNGFQDYSRVGQFYDIGAKLPIVGKPFIRFQSELARIIKNSALENPLHLATVVGTIWLMGEMASKASGETPEDKKTRESRFGTPVIPFTNIPLVFQTPYGEINIARMFGMYETAGADTTDKNIVQRVSKYLPVDVPTNKADLLRMVGNDVLTGGVVSTIADTDFRGKSIADPNQSKFKPTTLTPEEQNINRAKYLGYNYNLPFLNDAIAVGQAVQGETDRYGRMKTPAQALSKMAGFKVEQFGPEQAADQRIKDQTFEQYDKDAIKRNINSILKEQQAGKIDSETAKKRIEFQQGLLNPKTESGSVPFVSTANAKELDSRIVENPTGGFSYTDESGDFKTVKTRKKAETAVQKMDFEQSEENFRDLGDTVLRKNPDGTSRVQRKAEYNLESANYEMTAAKDDDDVDTWMASAEKKAASIKSLMLDPSVDPNEKMKYEHELQVLAKQYAKVQKLGDFTGAKKAKGMAAYNDKASLDALKMKVMNQLSSNMKVGKGVPKTQTRSLGQGRTVARRQQSLIRL